MARNRRAIQKYRRQKERSRKAIKSAHPKPSKSVAAKAVADHRAKLKAERDAADAREAAAKASVAIDQALTWYIVQTYPGHEERVEKRITRDRDRFEQPVVPLGKVYRPVEIVQRARRGKVYTSSRHVMPRHMFVGIAPVRDPRRVLEDVEGVYDVLRINGRDVSIPALELQRFANEIAEGNEELRGVGVHILVKGEKVRITRGPFAQWTGEVVQPSTGGAVVVEITIFGRKSTHPMPLDHLEAAA